jgi:WD40 repeat protein
MSANPDRLKKIKDFSRPDIVLSAARIPGSERLVLGSSGFVVSELDLSAAKPEAKELGRHDSYVTGVAVALAGKVAVSGSYDGRLIWWDLEKQKQIRAFEAHTKWIRGVEASRDGRVIASVADDMICRLWDATTGGLLHELRDHAEQTPHHYQSMLFACAFSPDGTHIATADKVGHVVVWDVATGRPVTAMAAPGMYTWDPVQRRHSIGGVRSLAFSPDGSLLAVGGIGKIGNIDHLEGKARVEVFDWKKRERTHELVSDKINGLVERLVFHPRDEWLLAAGGANDGFLMFFDLKAKKTLRQEKVGPHVHGVVLNESGNTIYVAGNRKVLVYSLPG